MIIKIFKNYHYLKTLFSGLKYKINDIYKEKNIIYKEMWMFKIQLFL